MGLRMKSMVFAGDTVRIEGEVTGVRREGTQAIVSLAQAHDRILDEVPPRTWTYASHVLRALTDGGR